jgi:hypothetical protein
MAHGEQIRNPKSEFRNSKQLTAHVELAHSSWLIGDKYEIRISKYEKKSKLEARNSKWFDLLTILSNVEGQCRMTEIQITQK